MSTTQTSAPHAKTNGRPTVDFSGSAVPAQPFVRIPRAVPTRPVFLPHQVIDIAIVIGSCLLVVFINTIRQHRSLDGPVLLGALQWIYSSGVMGFILLYCFLVILICSSRGLYEPLSTETVLDELLGLWQANLLATLSLIAFLYFSHNTGVSRALIIGTGGLSGVFLSTHRYWRRQRIEKTLEAGYGLRNALIIGAGGVGQALAELFARERKLGYVVKGFLDHNHNGDSRVLGSLEDLETVAQANFVDDIFITIPSERGLVKQLTLDAPRLRLNVNVVPELFDGLGWQAPLSYLGDFPIMSLHRERERQFEQLAKRVLDIFAAGMALAVLSPFLLLVALAIKLDSPGPVLFRPRRVGRKGIVFTCWKFRTMVQDAPQRLQQMQHLNEREGLLFKISNDPRITRIGKFLRKYSIDELPQLVNIVTGEMSLVGPRPPEISEYVQYQVGHLRRLQVPPGLTGLWQVTARQDPSFESYLRLDLQYIENWSLWLDLKIIVRTIPAVFRGTGQ